MERTWTGAGTDAYWSTAANWGGTAPRDGDDLVFPSGALRKVNTNDLSTLAVGRLRFTGAISSYTVRGAELGIEDGISVETTSGDTRVELPLTFLGRQRFEVTALLSSLVVVGDIEQGAHSLTLDHRGGLALEGILSGTGSLIKAGDGTATLGGSRPNTGSGTCTVQAGTLRLAKTTGPAVAGNLTVLSTVLWRSDNQLADTSAVTVRQGSMDLDGHSGVVGSLTFQGGSVTTGTGTLELNGPVSSLAETTTASMEGRLHLGRVSRVLDVADGTADVDLWIRAVISGGSSGSPPFVIQAGLTKTGPGTLELSGANTYSGLTSVSDGRVIAKGDHALGSDTGGVAVNDPGQLELVSALVGPKLLSLGTPSLRGAVLVANGDCGWAGRVALNEVVTVQAAGSLVFSGELFGTGGLLIEGDTIEFTGTAGNTYSDPTTVRCSLLTLRKPSGVAAVGPELTVGAKAGGPHVANAIYSGQFPASAVLTVLRTGRLALNKEQHRARRLVMSGGNVDTGLGTLEIAESIEATSALDDAEIDGTLRVPRGLVTQVTASLSLSGLRINAEIADSPGITGGLTKRGARSLWLANANTFTGSVIIEEGSVQAAHPGALGAAAGGVVVRDGAALVLRAPTDTLAEPMTLTGSGSGGQGALRVEAVVQNHADVTLSHGATLNTAAAAAFHLDGALAGGGALTKLGEGVLRLAGNTPNTLAGDVIVNQGILELDKSMPEAAILGNLI